jgi:putative membrane protein
MTFSRKDMKTSAPFANATWWPIVTWALLLIYLAYVVVSSLTDWLPLSASAWLFTPVINALVIVHALKRWSIGTLVIFYVTVFVISTAIENIGVLTGFPFGEYYYTEILGPQLGLVPIAIGFTYVPAAYISWVVAEVVAGSMQTDRKNFARITTAVVASVAMVFWDLGLDPLNSTVNKSWIWINGGAYYGVPILNFFGWFITVMCFTVPLSFFLAKRASGTANSLSRDFWLIPILTYIVMGLSRVLIAPFAAETYVQDGRGVQWLVSDIVQGSALVTIFTMGALAAFALTRVSRLTAQAGISPTPTEDAA